MMKYLFIFTVSYLILTVTTVIAFAGDSVSGSQLSPFELLVPTVVEVEDLGPLLMRSDRFDDAALRAFVFGGSSYEAPLPAIAHVPLPHGFWLMAGGLLALVGFTRTKAKHIT